MTARPLVLAWTSNQPSKPMTLPDKAKHIQEIETAIRGINQTILEMGDEQAKVAMEERDALKKELFSLTGPREKHCHHLCSTDGY